MSRDDGNAGAVLMAFVLGAVSGATVALLWAPSAGDETRRRLNEKAEETRRRLNEKAREGRERANDAARQGREFVSRQRETVASAIDRGREAYQRTRSQDEDASEEPA